MMTLFDGVRKQKPERIARQRGGYRRTYHRSYQTTESMHSDLCTAKIQRYLASMGYIQAATTYSALAQGCGGTYLAELSSRGATALCPLTYSSTLADILCEYLAFDEPRINAVVHSRGRQAARWTILDVISLSRSICHVSRLKCNQM